MRSGITRMSWAAAKSAGVSVPESVTMAMRCSFMARFSLAT